MPETQVIEYRREQIKRFITITNLGKENEAFHIDFDNLLRYLMQAPGVNFEATEYEKHLKRELEAKILNTVLTPDAMNTVSDYIWDLALFCTGEKEKKNRRYDEITRERAVNKHENAERLRRENGR